MPSAEDLLEKKYLRGTDGNLGNTSERRGGMAIVITRWRCVQGGGGGGRVMAVVGGWRTLTIYLNRNERNTGLD